MIKKLENKPILFYIWSFIMPFIINVIALVGLHITPFGDKTLVISDANGLYINYLGYVGRLVKGLEGITYSFEKGLGGNMMPHIGGTMSDPAFALFGIFDISDYPMAFTLVSVINLSICGLTMYILLADLYGHKRSNLIFSTSYALSGFLVVNAFQVIFFSGAQALPIMVMGLRRIMQGRNPILYILSLTYALSGSFYFGFTICVASVLFFVVYFVTAKEELEGKKLSVFFQYATASLFGGLLPICIWLPAFMGMMGGRLDQTKITDYSFWEKMPFIEIFSKLFTGANSTSQLVDGLPNIYVGLLPIALVILFFLNKGINKKIKIAAAVTIGFYIISFYIVAFDMLMHGGTTTNWFNFRYSYIFSFILVLIASYEWKYVDNISYSDLKTCFVVLLLSTIIIFSRKYEFVMGGEVILDYVLLLLIFLAYRLHKSKPQENPLRTFEAATILIVSIGLFLNYTISTYNIMDWGIKDSDYKETVNAVAPLVDAVKKADDGFYRMEVNKQRSKTLGNDPMLYGYYGVGHGGSNERNFVRQELSKLGVQWFNMRNYYAQGIPAATDALLGLKYLIANEDITDEKAYSRMTDMEKVGLGGKTETYDLFQSEYALPIAFLSNEKINNVELTYSDVFDNLNQVWKNISNSDSLAFIEEDDIEFESLNLSASLNMEAREAREIVRRYESESDSNNSASDTSDDETQSESNTSSEDQLAAELITDEVPQFASSIKFTFVAKRDGPVYVYHRAALTDNNGATEPVIKHMGNYHKGDVVTGYLTVNADYVNRIAFEESAGRFRAAYADLDALQNMSRQITKGNSTVERIKDNHLNGTMVAEKGQELLFTIPWDEGWKCYIDGERTDLTKVLGVFMAAKVSPGEHSFEMLYEPAGLGIGIKISIVTLICTILYLLFFRKIIYRFPAMHNN